MDLSQLPSTALYLAGTGVSVEMLRRVLGPTADYLGGELQQWVEQRQQNFGRIVRNAEKKIPEGEEGAVPPRVLARVVTEGSFCDDEAAVEYLGGVLASSHSGVSRDDRGATMTALIASLSTYELRTHYIFYSIARRHLVGLEANLGISKELSQHGRFYVSLADYFNAMEFTTGEDAGSLMTHSLWGLRRHGLIGDWGAGPAEIVDVMMRDGRTIPHPGIVFDLSVAGLNLFVWAHGLGGSKRGVDVFIDPSAEFDINDASLPIVEGLKLEDLPVKDPG